METIVNQLDSVNSNSILSSNKSPKNIQKLILKNFNQVTNWNELEKFENLEYLEIHNCYIDSSSFFKSLSQIKKLKVLQYDYNTFFKEMKKKTVFKLENLEKIIFVFPEPNEANLSLINLNDRDENIKNFINFLPNFPNAYQNVNQIELINYEIFINKIKEESLEWTFEELYKGKDIYFRCDIYNFLRLKNIKNIKLFDSDDIYQQKNIIEKIFSFPNTKKIKINNYQIEEIKKKITSVDTLLLKFEDKDEADLFLEKGITKDSSNKNIAITSWVSQEFFGYENQFKEILKSNLKNIVIETASQFLNQNWDYFSKALEFLNEEILKIKSLENLTFVFDCEEEWCEYDRASVGYIFDILKKTIKKKIKFKIKFKNIKTKNDLNKNYYKYIEIFNYYLNCQNNEKLSQLIEIDKLNLVDIQQFVKEIYLNELKTIIVIDNKSKSKTLKKFKDIELLDAYLDDPGYFQIFEGIVNMETLTEENELSFVDFYDYTFYETNWKIDDFSKNPGCCIPIVRKSFLDQSNETIFDQLECIIFHHIDIEDFPNYEEIYQKKEFKFPDSINPNNIKKFGIHSCEPLSLNFFKKFEKLEDLFFLNYVNQKDKNCWQLPQINNLKKLNLTINFPFMRDISDSKINKVSGIENCLNLEEVSIDVGYTLNFEESRWCLMGIDVSKLNNLKNLKKLKIYSIDQTLIKELPKLEKLESLEIINPCMITEKMSPDDTILHDPLTESDFNFLQYSKNLKILKIYFPRFNEQKINIKVDKFLNLINENLEEVKILCKYNKKELNFANDWYKGLLFNFKKLKKIELDIGCRDCKISEEYSSEYKSPYQIELRKKEANAKNPIFLDFKEINKLQELKILDVSFDENIGTRLKNLTEIKKSKINLMINENKISKKMLEEIFELIATKQEKFLLELQKNNLDEDIVPYKLSDENRKKYNAIADEKKSDFQINNLPILSLLKNKIRDEKGSL